MNKVPPVGALQRFMNKAVGEQYVSVNECGEVECGGGSGGERCSASIIGVGCMDMFCTSDTRASLSFVSLLREGFHAHSTQVHRIVASLFDGCISSIGHHADKIGVGAVVLDVRFGNAKQESAYRRKPLEGLWLQIENGQDSTGFEDTKSFVEYLLCDFGREFVYQKGHTNDVHGVVGERSVFGELVVVCDTLSGIGVVDVGVVRFE